MKTLSQPVASTRLRDCIIRTAKEVRLCRLASRISLYSTLMPITRRRLYDTGFDDEILI